jgi:hypothetical protein
MPKFFFTVRDDMVTQDDDGRELGDAEAARLAAIQGARSIAAEQVSKGYLHPDDRIEVEDGMRNLLFTVTFRDAVRIQPRL